MNKHSLFLICLALLIPSCVSSYHGLGEFSQKQVSERVIKGERTKPLTIEVTQKPTPEVPLLKFIVNNPNSDYIIRRYEKLEKTEKTTSYQPLATGGWVTGAAGLLYFFLNPAPDPDKYDEAKFDSLNDKTLSNRQAGLSIMLLGLGAGIYGFATPPAKSIIEKSVATFEEKTPKNPEAAKVLFEVEVTGDKQGSKSCDFTSEKGEGVIKVDEVLARALLTRPELPDSVTLNIKPSGGKSISNHWNIEEAVALMTKGTADWSKGKPSLQPYPESRLEIAGTSRAGESVILKLNISNRKGKGDCFRLNAVVKSPEPLFNRAILIGRVKAGEEKSVETPFSIPYLWLDKNIPINIAFEELNNNTPEPLEANLSLKGLPRPAFAYSHQVIDDGTGGSAGNGDGRIQKGEGVDLLITVKNVGYAPAKDVSVNIATTVQQGIELYMKSAELGEIAPDTTQSVRLNVAIKRDAFINELPLHLEIAESGFAITLTDRITLPLDTALQPKVITLSKKVYVTGNAGDIRSGAGADTNILAQAPANSSLDVVAQLGDWYKVKISETEFGWIPVAAVSNNVPVTELTETKPVGPIKIYPNSPPVIALASPQKTTIETTDESIRISGTAADDRSIEKVDILLNGETIKTLNTRGINVVERQPKTSQDKVPTYSFEQEVSLEKGQNEIRIIAYDDEGLSRPCVVMVTRVEEKGEVYVLVIGIGKYEDTNIRELPYAESDAREIYEFYTKGPKSLTKPENVTILLGGKADTKGIRRTLSALAKKAKESDTVICYYAGHGDTGKHPTKGTEYYMIPQDAVKDDLFGSAIELSDLQRLWSAVISKRKVFIADCCNSGGFTDLRGEKEGFEQGMGAGSVVITASDKGQKAIEDQTLKHGVFTYYFLKGLAGEADTDGNGKISVSEMEKYVKSKVPDKAKELGGVQTPKTKIETTGEIYLTR